MLNISKKLLTFLSIISISALTSCNNEEPPAKVEDKYVVIWQNDNGDILEIDRDLKKGTIPEYNGATPIKESNDNFTYTFNGWTPEIAPVTENIQYTATFKKVGQGEVIFEDKPTISLDKKTLTYGYYPQSHVSDKNIINKLNTLEPTSINGWYLLDNKYYAKETAKTFNDTKYIFDDKEEIISGNEYYFLVEPITWNILSNENNEYYILSSKLLDTSLFYKDYEVRNENIYPNNYEYSDIRNYLNNDFYNYAFTFNNTYIKSTLVDNSAKTTDSDANIYASNDTTDKIFLPSYTDYLNTNFGFENNPSEISSSRVSKLTDYARVKNAWCNIENNAYTSSYWTRSPSSKFNYTAINVNSAGYLSNYAVDGNTHAIRPALKIML